MLLQDSLTHTAPTLNSALQVRSFIQQQFKQPIQIRQWAKSPAGTAQRPEGFPFVPPRSPRHPHVYKNLAFPKLRCHSLCLTFSKEAAQASLNLWMIHPERRGGTQRQELNELSFINLGMMSIYYMTFHLELSQCGSKILQYHEGQTSKPFVLIY